MIFDAHCHLDHYPAEELRASVNEWRQRGVVGVLAVSTGLASAERLLELRQACPDFMHVAVGIHPERTGIDAAEVERLLALLWERHREIVAVGEVGLPHYCLAEVANPDAFLDEAIARLGVFLQLAAATDLPVVLHAPHDKAELTLAQLTSRGVRHAMFHWHKASPQVTEAIAQAGFYLSVSPEVVYQERDQQWARDAPRTQVLVESDSPWVYAGPLEGEPSTPVLACHAAEALARLWGVSYEEVEAQTLENSLRLFSLPRLLPRL